MINEETFLKDIKDRVEMMKKLQPIAFMDNQMDYSKYSTSATTYNGQDSTNMNCGLDILNIHHKLLRQIECMITDRLNPT